MGRTIHDPFVTLFCHNSFSKKKNKNKKEERKYTKKENEKKEKKEKKGKKVKKTLRGMVACSSSAYDNCERER